MWVMYHRDLYLEQETKYGYQNRYKWWSSCNLHLASCIWRKGRVWTPGLLPGAVVISRITVWRQLATPPHIVHQTVCVWWVGPPCTLGGAATPVCPMEHVPRFCCCKDPVCRLYRPERAGRGETRNVSRPRRPTQVELSIKSGRD